MITQNYIKMCEQAEEIQEIWCNPFRSKFGDLFWKGKKYLMIPSACELCIVSNFIPEEEIWLPTQEQTQEMSGLSWWEFDKRCNEIRRSLLEDPLSEVEIKTKEEAGICVVMEKKYHKFWTGEKWEAKKQ